MNKHFKCLPLRQFGFVLQHEFYALLYLSSKQWQHIYRFEIFAELRGFGCAEYYGAHIRVKQTPSYGQLWQGTS